MLKNYLLYNPFSSQKTIFFLIVLFLLSFKFFILTLLVLTLVALLFKKRRFDRSAVESLQSEILYAPFNGNVITTKQGNERNILSLKLPFLKSFGIQMPIRASVENYHEELKSSTVKNFSRYKSELTVQSELGDIKMSFRCFLPFIKPRIWCRSGDLVLPGAYIGYLPFGGKVDIELGQKINMLVQAEDKLQRIQTLLCSKGINHE